MSNFLKRVLFKSQSKSRSTTVDISEIVKSETTKPTESLIDYTFSNDAMGKVLQKLWEECNSAPFMDNAKFAKLMQLYVENHAILPHVRQTSTTNSITPDSIHQSLGHPVLFVLQLTVQLLDTLAHDMISDDLNRDSAEKQHTAVTAPGTEDQGATTNGEINLSVLFPAASSYSEQDLGGKLSTMRDARESFLLSLEALCTAAHWPHNCSVLLANLGKEFVKFVLRLVGLLCSSLKSAYSQWGVTARTECACAAAAEVEDNKLCNRCWELVQAEKSLDFALSGLLLLVRFVCRCHSVAAAGGVAGHPVCDLLPPQPWDTATVEAVVGGSCGGIDFNSRVVSPAGAGEFDKRGLANSFADAGVMATITHLLRSLHAQALTASTDTFTDPRSALFSHLVCRRLVALQAEGLFLLHTLLVVHPAEVHEFCAGSHFLILNNLLASHPSRDLLSTERDGNGALERLVVRRGLLCLRLNTLLSGHPGGSVGTAEPSPNFSCVLELPAICEFLFWVSQRFDCAMRYESEFGPLLRGGADADKVSLSVSFQSQFSAMSPLGYDLWPWRASEPSAPEAEFTLTLSDECSYYHLMPREATQHLKDGVMRRLAGYIVWDALLVELVNSTAFSSRMRAEGHSSSSSSRSRQQQPSNARKSTRRNIYFVFVVFQQLFDEKASSFSQGGREKRAAAAGGEDESSANIPLAQLKFAEYISLLFKMAEPEALFSILADLDVFRILAGRAFLRGGPDLADELPLETTSANETAELRSYATVKVIDSAASSSSKCVTWSGAAGQRGVCSYFWALLHDGVLDFFNGLVVYSLYFQASRASVPSYLAFDDVMELIVDALLRPPGGEEEDAVPRSVSYQTFLLLHNLSESVASLGEGEKNQLRRRLVGKLLSACESRLHQLSVLADSGSFKWLECYAAVSLILRLTSMSVCGNTDWSAVLSAVDSYPTTSGAAADSRDQDSATEPHSSSSGESSLSGLSLHCPPPFSSPRRPHAWSKRTAAITAAVALDPEDQLGSGVLSGLGKERLRAVTALLLDVRTQTAGLHLLSDIICLCVSATMSVTVGGETRCASSGGYRASDTALDKAVLTEVFRQIIGVLGQCGHYPESCDGFSVAVALLNLLTWLLRSRQLIYLRALLQESLRPFFADLLLAVTVCIRAFDEKNQRHRLFLGAEGVSGALTEGALLHDTAYLLRQSLSLLTAMLAGDTASKAELGLLSKHTKESNNEFVSHLFGNFRNIDKLKKMTGSAPSTPAPSGSSSKATSYVTSSGKGAVTFESLRDLILAAEPSPSRETVLVLFEMLLDGHYSLADSFDRRHVAVEGAADPALFSSDEDRPKIRNVHVVPDIFGLVQHCSTETQKFILSSFHNLVKGRASLVNLNACSLCKPRVIDLALDLFPLISDEVQAQNVTLIQTLGQHGISVSILKHLFRMLQSRGDNRPAYSWRVVHALQGMITEEDGPRQTFVFEGRTSGLRLPPIAKWPAQKNCSFCSWLKIEAPKSGGLGVAKLRIAGVDGQQQVNVYCPHILCLRNATGAGLEFYLRPSKITGMFAVVLKITAESGETSVLSPELPGMKVAEGRWHFLGFSISAGAGFYGKAEACIQLDDQFARQQMSSVKLPECITEPFIGDCPDSLRTPAHNNTMRGQMGAFYVFATALSEGQFRSIKALGPDYIYNFEPFSALYQNMNGDGPRKQQRVDPVLSILDGSLTPHIILAHNPVVWKGEYFLDNTPLRNEIRWKALPGGSGSVLDEAVHDGSGYYKMHALRLKGTYRSITQDVRLALNSLGGIKTVFPLFAQLDQHRVVRNTGSSTADPAGTSVDSSHDPNFLPSVLGLLISLLENNYDNQTIFARIHGFSIISYLFERASPEHFSSLTLDRLLELFHKLDSHPALQEVFLDQLLCNFKLWVFTPLSTQLRLFSTLGELVTINAQYLVEALGFQRLVDLLYLLYDYDAPNIDRLDDALALPSLPSIAAAAAGESRASVSFSASGMMRSSSSRDLAGMSSLSGGSSVASRNMLKGTIYSSDVWMRVGTGDVAGMKLKGAELTQVRSMVFSLLSSIVHIHRAFLPEDVQALMLYLAQTTSAASKVEILGFLLTLLCNEKSAFLAPHMLLGFAIGNSVSLVHALFDHESAHVRLLALVLFCKLVVLSLDYKLLPDIPRASRYYNKFVAPATGSAEAFSSSTHPESAERDTRTAAHPGLPSSQGNSDAQREAPTFSDTFEALGLGAQQFMSVLFFVQDRLTKSQAGDSAPKRYLQNKIIAQALQMAMCGEFCGHLLPIVAEAFGGPQSEENLQLADRVAAIDGSLDSSFVEFQTHRLPSVIVCVPMAFTSLLFFAASEQITLELRLAIVLNLKTAISRSVGNCDRLLAIGHWQEYLLQLIVAEHNRRDSLGVEADNGANSRLLSKSKAIGDACVWMLCEIQTTAMKVGRSTEALGISRHASSTKELTRPEVMRCVTRGDRVLGGVVLRESVERMVAVVSDTALLRTTGFSVLVKAVRCLVLEWSTLHPSAQTETPVGPPDLMLDHCDKMVHLNAWLVAVAAVELDDFLRASPPSGWTRNAEETEAAPSLWAVTEQLVGIVRSFSSGGALRWMMEEKSFRVRAGMGAPSPPKLVHGTSYTGGAFSQSAKLTSTLHPVPLSHAAGGLCSLSIRLCCRVHLSVVSPDNTDVTNQLRELLESCAPYPEVYEREALFVLAQLSDAMRTSDCGAGQSRSDRWTVASIELLVELAVAIREPLLSIVADGSYNRSFNALSESAFPASSGPTEDEMDRSTSGEVSRDPSMNSTAASFDASLHAQSSWSPSYLVLIKSLIPVVELPGDDESAAELWSQLMSKQISVATATDHQLVVFRLGELGLKPCTFEPQHAVDSRPSSSKREHWTATSTTTKSVDCLADSRAWRSSCLDVQTSRLRELIRSMDSQNRRLEAKWSRIFTELANERGPWGYSASGDQQQEVFWMLDACETNMHTKMRMRRNQSGTRHLMATQKSFGRHSYSTDSNLDALSSTRSVSEVDSSTGAGGGLQGIYRDLKRFKKKQLANMPFSAQQQQSDKTGGEASDGEDEDESDGETSDLNTLAIADNASADLTGADNDKILFSASAEIITAATNSSGGHTVGRVEVTRRRVSFIRQNETEGFDFANKTGNSEFMWACHSYPSSTWPGEEIHAACERLYQMRHVAVELFLTSRVSVFVNLFETKAARKLLRIIRTKLRAPHLNQSTMGRPKEVVAKLTHSGQTLTHAWTQHRITNFEYLMHLNVIAGRTFNDLAQYPVFPWVLADYTSPRIDLRDPRCFRDFRWPMGAQLDEQRRILTDKYEASASLMDDEVLPYHTGSHFSTAAMVIWYLIRMEPFTSYHVWLQDGKFDRPDRLFHSVSSTYRGCTTNPQDVKELIPEFFFCPDFLENVNDISFGVRQNGKAIDNVDMPAWCKDASDFVRINREALESDFVSRNLHHWIDLVFGYKQRPPHLGGSEAAVEACNVFVHLTYPDAVNLEEIRATDPLLYDRTVRQIDNYGQTPVQLFEKPHPERLPIDRVDIIWPIASVVTGVDTVPRSAGVQLDKPAKVLCYGDYKVSSSPVLLIGVCGGGLDKLVVVDSTRVIGFHSFQARQPDIVPPFVMKVDKTALILSSAQQQLSGSRSAGRKTMSSYMPGGYSSSHYKEKLAGVPFASQGVLSQNQQTAGTKVSATALSDKEYALIGTAGNKAAILNEEMQSRLKSVENDRRLQLSKSISQSSVRVAEESRSRKIKASSPMPYNAEPSTPIGNTRNISGDTSSAPTPLRIERRERVDEHLSCNLFAMLPDSKLLFSCAHWDNSFKVTAVDSGRLVQSVSHHREVVTCLALASDFGRHWLVTGSKDCIVIVWDLAPERENDPIDSAPLHILYGHDDCVNCLAVNAELDLVVSGSDDGTIIVHTLRDGSYLRSILIGISQSMYAKAVTAKGVDSLSLSNGGSSKGKPSSPKGGSPRHNADPQIYKRRVHLVAVTCEGYIVTYSGDGNLLSTHTMNGRYVKMVDAKERLHAMCVSEDGKTVLTGGERCLVVVRWVNNLTLANNGPRKDLDAVIDGSHDHEHAPFDSPIRSLFLTHQERHLIVGLESGHIRVLAQDSEYLRRKLHRKLMEIGILTF